MSDRNKSGKPRNNADRFLQPQLQAPPPGTLIQIQEASAILLRRRSFLGPLSSIKLRAFGAHDILHACYDAIVPLCVRRSRKSVGKYDETA